MSSRRDQWEENCQFRILENALSVMMLMSEVLFWFLADATRNFQVKW